MNRQTQPPIYNTKTRPCNEQMGAGKNGSSRGSCGRTSSSSRGRMIVPRWRVRNNGTQKCDRDSRLVWCESGARGMDGTYKRGGAGQGTMHRWQELSATDHGEMRCMIHECGPMLECGISGTNRTHGKSAKRKEKRKEKSMQENTSKKRNNNSCAGLGKQCSVGIQGEISGRVMCWHGKRTQRRRWRPSSSDPPDNPPHVEFDIEDVAAVIVLEMVRHAPRLQVAGVGFGVFVTVARWTRPGQFRQGMA